MIKLNRYLQFFTYLTYKIYRIRLYKNLPVKHGKKSLWMFNVIQHSVMQFSMVYSLSLVISCFLLSHS